VLQVIQDFCFSFGGMSIHGLLVSKRHLGGEGIIVFVEELRAEAGILTDDIFNFNHLPDMFGIPSRVFDVLLSRPASFLDPWLLSLD